ncbi:Ppx/GppA family phosphatase [Eggerthellaceae bacterium zg-887]|uniref:Ppx/GppA phosphatase family protein n=1 Tax=Xiamenia xianingshaonis TaxID=2682776 RepID=UPI00140739F6|nr:Ppx/GppA family phosphatase [Xiamenia xianingshaonis]NHM15148.1 Ppx/GppA family phosphatase [Xiamenia xianingshaonis]
MTVNPASAASASSRPPYRAGRYAAIDIGTVTCRMLVADVSADGSICELDREYQITNLGEGVDASGVLLDAAMERVATAVRGFQSVRKGFEDPAHAPIKVTTMATSASRDAANAADFERLLAKEGIALSVIEGAKEASLSFRGVTSDFGDECLMVVDIGGGSTEIVGGFGGSEPAFAHSFNIGCRRVTEKFLHADPPDSAEIAAARAWIRAEMKPFFDEIARLPMDVRRLVAVAGTATTVVSVAEAMERYDTKRVHRYVVTRQALDEVYERFVAVPQERRAKIVGLDPGRAPVIVAGMVILQEVLDLAGFDSFTVSESDILHGIVLEAAQQ